MAAPCPTNTINGCQFTQFLVDQQPVYDKLILEDIRPEDGWILHVETGTFPSNSGVQHTLDRFNHVWPNVTKVWNATQAGNCLGTPCNLPENYITWGSTRLTYFLEQQSWATPLLCYDQEMHITQAKEQFRQIISDILKPASSAINSNFLRKRVAQFAGQQWIANRNFGSSSTAPYGSTFTYNWVQVNGEEIYIDTNCPNTQVFKLTPQMLQRRFTPLSQWGYFGKQPFKDMPPMIELVTDMETCWELDRLGGSQGVGGGNNPTVIGNWRFEQWDATSKYWKYNYSGQIGNYVVRVDPLILRFNFVGAVNGLYRYQVVLPYKNVPSSGAGGAAGQKDIPNPDWFNAQYQWSYIWHRKALQVLVADATPINPEMPFSSRNFGGKWQFVMDNLGADAQGNPIENKRRNKGQFISDFKMAIRPQYTELSELIFHKREPQCVYEIATCNADPGYPAQQYESDLGIFCTNQAPSYTLLFTPVQRAAANSPFGVADYALEANSVICNGAPVEGNEIGNDVLTNTLALLAQQLNNKYSVLCINGDPGGWTVLGSQIQLVGGCTSVTLPWLT
jgi:hypothetical protein